MSRSSQARSPFLRLRPASLSAVLLTCEHARHALPPPLRAAAPDELEILRSHWGWDPGAWDLTRALSRRTGFGAVGARWSRLVIDPNRRIDDPTLIRHEAEGVALSFNQRLAPSERERRIDAYHAPYHAEIDRLLMRRIVRGIHPAVLAIHSFTPVLHRHRRDFDVGVLYDDHAVLARRLARRVRAAGFRVRMNEPYSGIAGMMYAADRHGSHLDLPCLELEVNQARIGTRDQAEEIAGRLADAIAALGDDG
jgi:predicted N-formylglutamate amidohydrolase